MMLSGPADHQKYSPANFVLCQQIGTIPRGIDIVTSWTDIT